MPALLNAETPWNTALYAALTVPVSPVVERWRNRISAIDDSTTSVIFAIAPIR